MNQDFRTWILANSAFIAAQYLGLFWSLPLLATVAAAVVWVALAAYLTVYFSKNPKPRTAPAPRWVSLTVDAVALGGWLTQGWYVTGAAYLASMIALTAVYSRSNNLPQSTSSDSSDEVGLPEDLKIAVEVGNCMSTFLTAPTDHLGFVYSRVPQDSRADYLLGFISSAADVVAQSLGAKSGGNASINGTLRTLSATFGEESFEPYFHRTIELHDNPTPDFRSGFEQGNRWANALLQHRSDEATLIVMDVFGSRYSECSS